MSGKVFRYTAIAMNVLEKLVGTRFSVTGLENLPNEPVLFVANHFTRSETFFVPYLIHKYTKRQVRCLADHSLFHGMLGRLLKSTGTVSTRDAQRNNIILSDLITGRYDWMIYPEGAMIKNKKIENDGSFISHTPHRVGAIRTGSAVLALQSQIYRDDIIAAHNAGEEITEEFIRSLNIKYESYFEGIATHIVPLTISYYPIRPGENALKRMLQRVIKNFPKQIAEEIEIEGNLLRNATIDLYLGAPINIKEYIGNTKSFIDQIPVIKAETKSNLVIKYYKHQLTQSFMSDVYSNLQINLDHLFAATINVLKGKRMNLDKVRRIFYLSAVMIEKTGKYRIHPILQNGNLVKLFSDESFEEFDSLIELAQQQNLIELTMINNVEKIFVKNTTANDESDFHKIRVENTLAVINNEFSLLDFAKKIVENNARLHDVKLQQMTFDKMLEGDNEIFDSDYEIYFDEKFSKEKSIGRPFFLDAKLPLYKMLSDDKESVGILLVHGYKSAPQEVAPLAEFLNKSGFKTYAVRLSGHGTAPKNLSNISWHDWYDSVERGYAILRNVCKKVVLIGFSTGGLLSLLYTAHKKNFHHIAAVISINSALKLRDIRARMVPGINIWNEFLEKFHIESARLEYIDDKPENPYINYSRNYIHGVAELEKLMDHCEENLAKITVPSLIIQAKNDPVVDPISAKLISDKITSKNKKLIELDFSNHVIINCQRQQEVFEVIGEFLQQQKL